VPKQLRSLDHLIVPNPCNADWDSMSGNDRVRFCEHCSLSVTNLSNMTRHEARLLIARSEGRLCVRFVQSPGGRILTDVPDRLYRIGRRVSRIAAGAFTATLSLSTVAAQSTSRSQLDAVRPNSETAKTASPRETGAALSGVVTDPQGALVPGANLTLTNTQTHVAFTCTSDEDGAYKFSAFEPGVYSLAAEATGFAKTETPALNFKGDVSQTENLVLQIPPLTAQVEINAGDIETQITVTAGVVSFREPEEPLVKAAWQNDLAEVSRLALSGSDVNVIDKATDMGGLAFAVQNGKRDMVNVLLSAGANPNLANTRGETPLMYLGDHATTELVGDLLSAGADVNASDQSGATPLINLAASGSFEVVKRLLDAGARIDVEDNNGNTLLMSAAQNEDPQLLRHLLKAGLNLSAKNQNGDSALMSAARSGKADGLESIDGRRRELKPPHQCPEPRTLAGGGK